MHYIWDFDKVITVYYIHPFSLVLSLALMVHIGHTSDITIAILWVEKHSGNTLHSLKKMFVVVEKLWNYAPHHHHLQHRHRQRKTWHPKLHHHPSSHNSQHQVHHHLREYLLIERGLLQSFQMTNQTQVHPSAGKRERQMERSHQRVPTPQKIQEVCWI